MATVGADKLTARFTSFDTAEIICPKNVYKNSTKAIFVLIILYIEINKSLPNE